MTENENSWSSYDMGLNTDPCKDIGLHRVAEGGVKLVFPGIYKQHMGKIPFPCSLILETFFFYVHNT